MVCMSSLLVWCVVLMMHFEFPKKYVTSEEMFNQNHAAVTTTPNFSFQICIVIIKHDVTLDELFSRMGDFKINLKT